MGSDILVMLGNQRETLLSTRQTLESSAADSQRSHRLISQMMRSAYKTKCMMVSLIVFMCAASHSYAREHSPYARFRR